MGGLEFAMQANTAENGAGGTQAHIGLPQRSES